MGKLDSNFEGYLVVSGILLGILTFLAQFIPTFGLIFAYSNQAILNTINRWSDRLSISALVVLFIDSGAYFMLYLIPICAGIFVFAAKSFRLSKRKKRFVYSTLGIYGMILIVNGLLNLVLVFVLNQRSPYIMTLETLTSDPAVSIHFDSTLGGVLYPCSYSILSSNVWQIYSVMDNPTYYVFRSIFGWILLAIPFMIGGFLGALVTTASKDLISDYRRKNITRRKTKAITALLQEIQHILKGYPERSAFTEAWERVAELFQHTLEYELEEEIEQLERTRKAFVYRVMENEEGETLSVNILLKKASSGVFGNIDEEALQEYLTHFDQLKTQAKYVYTAIKNNIILSSYIE